MSHVRPGSATRIFYWVQSTGRCESNTGIQRVVRALGTALEKMPDVELVPVQWCGEREAIVVAETALLDVLGLFGGPKLAASPDAGRPLHLARSGELDGAWLLLPEVPHVDPDVTRRVPVPVVLDYVRHHGLRSACVFYDLIPLRMSGYEHMREAHTAYALALAAADVVMPISVAAGRDLEAWWGEAGHDLDRLSRTRPVPLPAEITGVARRTAQDTNFSKDKTVRLVALGTVEPDRNQLALMEAVTRLAERRLDIELQLDIVGPLHEDIAARATQAAEASNGRIRLIRNAQDADVYRLVEACTATVFVSLTEGFGLPINESLWLGKPCICSNIPPMTEIAEGGGCLLVDPRHASSIEAAIERLADEQTLRERLGHDACTRHLRTWQDYGSDLLDAMRTSPLVADVIVIEGSTGGSRALALDIEALGTRVRRLRWRIDTGALIPVAECFEERLAPPGSGDFRGFWAILPVNTTLDPAEILQIQDEAHGLGLRIALLFPSDRADGPADLLASPGSDMSLFANETQHDAALAALLQNSPGTATLRAKCGVAAGAEEILSRIHAQRAPAITAGVPRLPRRIYYWVSMTSTQSFNTGIQRVVRALGAALLRAGVEVVPVKLGPDDRIAALGEEEARVLAAWGGPACDPKVKLPASLAGEWLLHPEITCPPQPAGSNVPRFARSLGMRVASIFFDLIVIKQAEIYEPDFIQAISDHLVGFAEADIALPISHSVVGDLRRFLVGRGLSVPALVVCPLAGDRQNSARTQKARGDRPAGEPLRLMAVGTFEKRKNYPGLLRALIAAKSKNPLLRVELTIIGQSHTADALEAEIKQLAADAEDVTLLNHISDEQLTDIFDACHATVFASYEEGFGLPVLESLWQGLPCLCHDGSALAEVASGGGALMVDMKDVESIATGIVRLADENGLLSRLSREAVARPIRTWDAYARDVLLAMARTPTAPGWLEARLSVEREIEARDDKSAAQRRMNGLAGWLRRTLRLG